MRSFKELWPYFMDGTQFFNFIVSEYQTYEKSIHHSEPVPAEFLNVFYKKIEVAYKDYSQMMYEQLFRLGDEAYLKPRFYFWRLQLRFLRNQLADFEQELAMYYGTLKEVSIDYFIQQGMEDQNLTYQKAREQGELENEKVLKKYRFLNQIVEPFLDQFSKTVAKDYYYFNKEARTLIHDLDERDLMGEEAMDRMSKAFLSYSDKELETLMQREVEGISKNFKNPWKNNKLKGEQLGILAGYLQLTGLINISVFTEISSLLHQLTGVPQEGIRKGVMEMSPHRKHAERLRYLSECKHNTDSFDLKEVKKYLKKVIDKIDEDLDALN